MKRNLIKTISMAALAATLVSANPIGANAAWKQNSTGWWYTEGNSWATGFREIDGKSYYFGADGYMKTGWVNINGSNYHFDNSGKMDKNTVVDNYFINEDGVRGVKVNISNANEAQGIAIQEDEGFLEHFKGKYPKVKAINSTVVTTLKNTYFGENNFGMPDEPYYSFTVFGGEENAPDEELTQGYNYYISAVSKRVFAMGTNLNCKVYEIKDGSIVNTFAPSNLNLQDWR